MKIALIIDTWFPITGGGQINAIEISKRIAGKNTQIDIITRNCGSSKDKYPKYLKVIKLGAAQSADSYASKVKFATDAFLYVAKNKYDLVHAHAFFPGFTAKALSLFANLPSVYTVHGTSLGTGLNPQPLELLEKILLTSLRYDRQITVSRDFLKLKNVNKNIVYIPNGVDAKKFQKQKVRKNAFPSLLFVGRLHKQKNLESLLRAMPNLLERFPNLKLQIVGKGKIKSDLVSLARSLSIQKSVKFTGEKKGKEIIKLYKSSHLLLLPSLYEGQPLVLLEAWASHLTPVAAKVGDIPYLIKDSVNGFLIKGTEPKDITSAVLRALKADLNTIAQNGYNFVKENYTWENAAKQTKKVYEILIKTGN